MISVAPEVPAYICTYGSHREAMDALAKILLGVAQPTGRLPVTIGGYSRGSTYICSGQAFTSHSRTHVWHFCRWNRRVSLQNKRLWRPNRGRNRAFSSLKYPETLKHMITSDLNNLGLEDIARLNFS